ncbi:MAG: hypothetical protein SPK63_01310 [Eubacteriales bacterium]|nr:hypothetical protein [Eubacteriales bacterium]
MKTPLRYQITEYDCGSVSLINCITYLKNRKEIPPMLIKMIWQTTLDLNDEDGHIGVRGTSTQAMQEISDYINKHSEFGLSSQVFKNAQVDMENILKILNDGGVINFRIKDLWNVEHYIMITQMDDDWVYVWDPYYCNKNDIKNENIEICNQNQFNYNIKIKRIYFASNSDTYSINSANQIEMLAMFNKKGE